MSELTLPRGTVVRRAFALTYLTIAWNLVEGVVALVAAAASGSVALVGFGVDSFVESTSAGIMLWRLNAESSSRSKAELEHLDRRAHRLIGLSLFGLAAFVAADAVRSLVQGERPERSTAGMVITSLSLLVMFWLARAKKRTARALESRAMEADAFQTTACWWLSLITLCGLALNWTLGWWWADPAAALGMTWFVAREGREAWKGDACC